MKEGQYKWVNGQTVGSIPWQSGEPTGNTDQNCLVIKGADKYDFWDRIQLLMSNITLAVFSIVRVPVQSIHVFRSIF